MQYDCTGGTIEETERPACHDDAHCEFLNDIPTCVCDRGHVGDGLDCQRKYLKFNPATTEWGHL